MKIISKFKDFYDHISYIYGKDPKVTWERKLFNDHFPLFTPDTFSKKELELDGLHIPSNCKYEFRWLIVCGKQYLLFRKSESPKTSGDIWTAYKDSEEVEDYVRIYKNSKRINWSYWSTKPPEHYMGQFYQKNLDFCIKHKSPIIVTEGSKFVTDSPILGNIVNFVSMYSAEQIYQDISYFLSNQINGSPDINPPVSIDNNGKIEAHGFDLKQSFRHRK